MSSNTILVIDDDEEILQLIRDILESDGCTVLTSTNSIEANSHIFGGNPPDLIIIDYMMPLANGDNKVTLLKANESTKQIPIILVSGKSEGEILSIMLRSGADAYLLKPFTRQKLVDVVKTTLRNAAIAIDTLR